MRRGKTPALWFLAALIFTGLSTPALPLLRAAEPQQISFPSGKLKLEGFIYKPEGKGPFPAVLYNHGSERKPGWQPDLGDLFSKKGYVFFLPHRRGHGRSPNDAQVDSLYQEGARSVVALQDIHLEDQLAALSFLKQFTYVDPTALLSPAVPMAVFRQCSPLKPMRSRSWVCAQLLISLARRSHGGCRAA